jgi:hypothetical protein
VELETFTIPLWSNALERRNDEIFEHLLAIAIDFGSAKVTHGMDKNFEFYRVSQLDQRIKRILALGLLLSSSI